MTTMPGLVANATHQKMWLLRLVPSFRFGRLFCAAVLLAVLLPVFYSGDMGAGERSTPAFFFSLIIAYIIPVFSFITAKSQEALQALKPLLDLDEREFTLAKNSLHAASPFMVLLCLVAGVLSGCIHLTLIRASVVDAFQHAVGSLSGLLTALGTLTVWVIMTTVIAKLIQQSLLFGQLGARHVGVSLLDTQRLVPFAHVAISSSLAIIGALAFFPLIGLESGQNLMESLPGVIAITGPLIVMFVIPVWPIHQRLLAEKQRQMATLNQRIRERPTTAPASEMSRAELDEILPLVQFRREITQVSTWPFDLGNMTTLAMYMVIPPFTWAGAALIEHVVDSLL